jgi:glycosyltransferase involved in cell wall biosynthesis
VTDPLALSRAHVMNNGLPLDTVPEPAAERAPEILFVGRVTRDKGSDTFVAACALALPRLPGWHAAMVGADRIRVDSQATPFVREVTTAAEAAGIAMLGFMPNDATLARFAQCGIAVVPSRWHDPFPRVAQEAMACGAPLITTERGGLPESAGDAALYIDPEDPASLAAAIERLALDPALRAELGARGRKRMRDFAMPQTQARWSALRRSVLG